MPGMSEVGWLDRLPGARGAMIGTKFEQMTTAVNEMRGDFSAQVANYQDLVTELKAAITALKTLTDELHDDHATFVTLTDELHDDHATVKSAIDALKAYAQDHITTGDPGIGIGTTKPNIRTNAAVEFVIGGVGFSKASTDDFWTLDGAALSNSGNDTRGYQLISDNAGTASVQATADATDVASLVWPAAPASRVILGTVTIINASAGDFTPNTTDLDTAGLTVAYNDGLTLAGNLAVVLPDPAATITASKVSTITAVKITDSTVAVPADLSATAVDTLTT